MIQEHIQIVNTPEANKLLLALLVKWMRGTPARCSRCPKTLDCNYTTKSNMCALLRAEAKIDELTDVGREIVILSGDNSDEIETVGERLTLQGFSPYAPTFAVLDTGLLYQIWVKNNRLPGDERR